jgi:predicted transcriptional regulator
VRVDILNERTMKESAEIAVSPINVITKLRGLEGKGLAESKIPGIDAIMSTKRQVYAMVN